MISRRHLSVGGNSSCQSQETSIQRQWNLVDTVSYSLGRHQLKFGVDYRRLTPFAVPEPVSALPAGRMADASGGCTGPGAGRERRDKLHRGHGGHNHEHNHCTMVHLYSWSPLGGRAGI